MVGFYQMKFGDSGEYVNSEPEPSVALTTSERASESELVAEKVLLAEKP
jgi:hypothetical protein